MWSPSTTRSFAPGMAPTRTSGREASGSSRPAMRRVGAVMAARSTPPRCTAVAWAAVAPGVGGDHPPAGGGEGVDHAPVQPVEAAVGDEAVVQHDRGSRPGAAPVLEGDVQPVVGGEGAHAPLVYTEHMFGTIRAVGYQNPPVPWKQFEAVMSGRARRFPSEGDGGDAPAWSYKRPAYEPPAGLLA